MFKLNNTAKDYIIRKDEYGFFIYLYVAGEKRFDFHLSNQDNPEAIFYDGIRISELLKEFKINLKSNNQ